MSNFDESVSARQSDSEQRRRATARTTDRRRERQQQAQRQQTRQEVREQAAEEYGVEEDEVQLREDEDGTVRVDPDWSKRMRDSAERRADREVEQIEEQREEAREEAREERREARREAEEQTQDMLEEEYGERPSRSDLVWEDGEVHAREEWLEEQERRMAEEAIEETQEVMEETYGERPGRDDISVDEEGIVTVDDAWVEEQQRREAVEELSEELDTDVGVDDIEQQDGTFQLTEETQREIAAVELDDEIDWDVTVDDIEQQDGEFQLTEDAQREQAAEELSSELDADIEADDIEQQDGTFQLTEETQREIAAAELDAEVDQDVTADDLELRDGEYVFEYEERVEGGGGPRVPNIGVGSGPTPGDYRDVYETYEVSVSTPDVAAPVTDRVGAVASGVSDTVGTAVEYGVEIEDRLSPDMSRYEDEYGSGVDVDMPDRGAVGAGVATTGRTISRVPSVPTTVAGGALVGAGIAIERGEIPVERQQDQSELQPEEPQRTTEIGTGTGTQTVDELQPEAPRQQTEVEPVRQQDQSEIAVEAGIVDSPSPTESPDIGEGPQIPQRELPQDQPARTPQQPVEETPQQPTRDIGVGSGEIDGSVGTRQPAEPELGPVEQRLQQYPEAQQRTIAAGQTQPRGQERTITAFDARGEQRQQTGVDDAAFGGATPTPDALGLASAQAQTQPQTDVVGQTTSAVDFGDSFAEPTAAQTEIAEQFAYPTQTGRGSRRSRRRPPRPPSMRFGGDETDFEPTDVDETGDVFDVEFRSPL